MTDTYFIKDELSNLDEEKKNIFLIHFNKVLEENKVMEWNGQGGFAQDEEGNIDIGYFINTDFITLQAEDGQVFPLVFKSHWIKGVIEFIEVSCERQSLNWREFIFKKVSIALASAFAQKVETFFFRTKLAYIGPRLEGAYYVQKWRIAPATPEVDSLTESIIYLDMDIVGIDRSHARAKFEAKSKEIMAILSVIFNKEFYQISHQFRWVLLEDKDAKPYQLGYRDDEPYPNEMPSKNPEKAGKFVEPDEVTKNTLDKRLYAPKNIRKIFKAFESLKYEEKDAFLSAAKMYQIALSFGRRNKTVNSSYQLAALDALSKPKRENNKNKNAIISLVKKYFPDQEIKIGQLYESMRSAHFHQGFFSDSDINGLEIRPFMGPDFLLRDEEFLIQNDVTRTVLINWLTERIPSEYS